MLKNKIQTKSKTHILLIISLISVFIISFFFAQNQSQATSTTNWTFEGYDGNLFDGNIVTSDEPIYRIYTDPTTKEKVVEDERIGIDDIVYNRVPLFDVNVFSDKPGGQEIDTTSPLYFLRTVVANWFVLGMNLSLAAMIIIIMYTGIRMALTTIAEQKAEYKEMLLNFVKAIAKIFLLAAILAFIMNLSQYFTALFAGNGPRADSEIGGRNLYMSIATRALGTISFKAKIPAAILFFGLALTFFKFCYKYTKRLLNVYLLIIIAPVLVAKDAYEGATGKQGKTFSAWIQEITLNVALQPAHALIYTTLVYVALENGTRDIMSFAIAVLIMNFMVSADKIFFKIFNMRFTKGPGSAGAADAVTEGLKMYAGIQAAKEGAKIYGKTVKGTSDWITRKSKVLAGRIGNISNNIAASEGGAGNRSRKNKETEKKNKEDRERAERAGDENNEDPLAIEINKRKQAKRERNAKHARKQIQGIQEIEDGQGVWGIMPVSFRRYRVNAKANKAMKSMQKAKMRSGGDKSFLSRIAETRKMAKRNDEVGRMTRKLLKLKRDREIKKFKYIATGIGGVAIQTLAILAAPALIAADETDMALAATTATMGNTSKSIAKLYYYRKNAEEEFFAQKSFEDTLESLKNANTDLGTLQAKFDAIDQRDEAAREIRRDTYIKMAAYSELKLDETTLRRMINAHIRNNEIKVLDQSTLEDVLDRVLSDAGVNDLGIDVESVKASLMVEIVNNQTTTQVKTKFEKAVEEKISEKPKGKNRFATKEVIDIAKEVIGEEDISELTDKQIINMFESATIQKMGFGDAEAVSRKVQEEILKIADSQRETKFESAIEGIIGQDDTFETIKEKLEEETDNKIESLVEKLAVEKAEDSDKYVQILVDKLDSEKITDEQKETIRETAKAKISKAIDENHRNRDQNRFIAEDTTAAFAKSGNRFVKAELQKLGDNEVLSKEVREAIDNIKANVKHEKTKKRSIGTIADLDSRLRKMRDVL